MDFCYIATYVLWSKGCVSQKYRQTTRSCALVILQWVNGGKAIASFSFELSFKASGKVHRSTAKQRFTDYWKWRKSVMKDTRYTGNQVPKTIHWNLWNQTEESKSYPADALKAPSKLWGLCKRPEWQEDCWPALPPTLSELPSYIQARYDHNHPHSST